MQLPGMRYSPWSRAPTPQHEVPRVPCRPPTMAVCGDVHLLSCRWASSLPSLRWKMPVGLERLRGTPSPA